MTSQEVSRWADSAMYRSEPLWAGDGPKVYLLNATPDPLGSLAALCDMYKGRVVRSLNQVTDEERHAALDDMMRTELSGPLEVAQFHFLVEGVTRAFTHQMVRERQAFFAQESMRFAVPGDEQNWTERAAYPPSLAAEPSFTPWASQSDKERLYTKLRDIWDGAIEYLETAYTELIDAGIPAEDARGLMPHAMTTRLHWVLDLRSLLHVAGLRLCTQAQFEWRLVMAGVVNALRNFENVFMRGVYGEQSDGWQFKLIADKLQPVCYQKGRCGFMAQFDRGCTIRERVEEYAKRGIPSSQWERGVDNEIDGTVLPIHPREWAADPTAARRRG